MPPPGAALNVVSLWVYDELCFLAPQIFHFHLGFYSDIYFEALRNGLSGCISDNVFKHFYAIYFRLVFGLILLSLFSCIRILLVPFRNELIWAKCVPRTVKNTIRFFRF